MIVIDELPFRFVEQEGFRLFCAIACPKFNPPSRITIARDIMSLYNDKKKKLKSFIAKNSQSVSLTTTDTWTSIQNVNYMVLTAHFIDADLKMQKMILNFCQIPNHKRETIGKAIESCLKQWGIEKVFKIIVDNASSNNGAITHMRKRLQIWKTTVCDGEFLHVRCSVHILNLIVGDGLKEFDLSIVAVRNAVRYVRASPSRLARFRSCVKNTSKEDMALVCLDVPTRWNSTYLMLEHALKFVEAFKLLEEEDGFYLQYFLETDKSGKAPTRPPNPKDWDNCAIFCDAFEDKNELERYLAEPNEDISNRSFDILARWKVTSSNYHILSMIARDVLAIQVSTVASESAFSTGGRVLDCFRSSLSPTMVEALICCQNWLRASPLPLDMVSILEEHVTYESAESDDSTMINEPINLD